MGILDPPALDECHSQRPADRFTIETSNFYQLVAVELAVTTLIWKRARSIGYRAPNETGQIGTGQAAERYISMRMLPKSIGETYVSVRHQRIHWSRDEFATVFSGSSVSSVVNPF